MITQAEWYRTVERQQPSSKERRTGGALPEPYKMTSSSLLVCILLNQTVQSRLHEGGSRVRHPLVGPVLTAQHHTA